MPIPSIFMLLCVFFDAINSLCRRFLWHGSFELKHRAPIAWDQVCKRPNQGGVGIKEILAWNKANMAKWLFDLSNTSSTSLWKKWLYLYKIKHGSIWTATPKTTDTKWWKDLLGLRDELQ